MASGFWTNTVWYISLGLTTVAEVGIALYRAPDRRQAVAFYFTLAGMTLWLETVLLIFLKAYAYRPAIINDPAHTYDDILAGNLFSQFSIAASMLLTAVLRLKPRWYFVLALGYGAVEELFIALHIYEQFWYLSWITVALLPVAFLLARRMYDALCEGLRPALYFAYVAFALFPLVVITVWWGISLADLQMGNPTLLPDGEASEYGIVAGVHLLISTSLLAAWFGGAPWRIRALVMTALLMAYAGLYRGGLLLIRDGWFLPTAVIIIGWTYASIVLTARLYGLPDVCVARLLQRTERQFEDQRHNHAQCCGYRPYQQRLFVMEAHQRECDQQQRERPPKAPAVIVLEHVQRHAGILKKRGAGGPDENIDRLPQPFFLASASERGSRWRETSGKPRVCPASCG